MARPVTLFTDQWADMPLAELAGKAASWGFDGLELACRADHFEVEKALADGGYCQAKRDLLGKHGLEVHAISTHAVGQCVCDRIDSRHKSLVSAKIWGDGDPAGVRKRAARHIIDTAKAAKRLGVKVVNGFTGSSIWHLLYPFPPAPPEMIEAGYEDFARRWTPILDAFRTEGVKFALEVHPTEIAFDIASAQRALEAVKGHESFGFNYDPSHLAYQGVDYVKFIRTFSERIFHVHVKDVWWSHGDGTVGVFGGHVDFGDSRRYWDFRSIGHGDVNFEEIIVALNDVGYQGPLSVEWEDRRMDREHGAAEACAAIRKTDFQPSRFAFDPDFGQK